MKRFKFTIYKNKDSNNLYLRILGQRIATGVADTVEGRKAVTKYAETIYQEYLSNKGILVSNKTQEILIKDVADEYLAAIKQKNTRYVLLNALNHINYSENYPINKENISRRILILKRTDKSETSINSIIGKIQTFLNKLFDEEIIPEKIELKKYLVKAPKKENIPYTNEEIELILSKAKEKDKEFYLLLVFLRCTGFRIGETLNLKQSNFDFNKGFITVPNKINKKHLQRFPISNVIERVFFEVKAIRTKEFDDNRFFRWTYEGKSRLTKWLAEIENCLEFKVRGRGFHAFRRAFADSMFDNGLSFDVIKDLMRHSSIDITLEHYKSYQKTKLAKELEKLNFNYEI